MDTTDAEAGGRSRVLGLAELIQIPLRRWRIVVIAASAVVLAAIAYLVLIPPTYTATTVVVLRPVVTDPFSYPSGGADRAINMTAENGIATSSAVIDRVAEATGRSPVEVRKSLEIEIPTGGQVMRFVFTGKSEGQAIRGANAAAETYLTVREGIYEEQRAELLKSYDSTIASVTDQRNEAQDELPRQLGQNVSSPSTQAILDEVRALNNQLAQLAEQRAKIASADLQPGVVTASARAPVPSSHDRAPMYLAGALLGGLLVGAAATYLFEAADRRIRTLGQAADATGLPVLGTVRRAQLSRLRPAPDIRYVALAVTSWVEANPGRPIVVVSSLHHEGRPQLAAGLAVGFASVGHAVYLGATPATVSDLKAMVAKAGRTSGSATAASSGDAVIPSQNGYHEGLPAGVGAVAESGAGKLARGSIRAAAKRRSKDLPPAAPVPAGTLANNTPISGGTVRVGPLDERPEGAIIVLDAPAAEEDDRGLRAAREGAAIVVVARHRSRYAAVGRLMDRLRSADVTTLGIVVAETRRV